MFDLRRLSVGTGGWVVSARGDFDGAAAADVAAAVAACDDTVIVDLLGATLVDLDVVDAFVHSVGPGVTYVAERRMLQALLAIGLQRPVKVESTLVAALA